MSSSDKYRDQLEQRIRQWLPPDVGRPHQALEAHDVEAEEASPLTAEQLSALQKQAYDEGYENGNQEGFEYGHKEGLEAARNEIASNLERLDTLIETLDAPLKQLDDQVERSMIDLVISMVRQLVRREVKADPGQIIGVMREALSILPISSRNIRIVMHPDDAEFVRNVYEMSENDMGWEIVDDPVLTRGGCRVVTETSQVDATLESRIANLIAPLIGGDERDKGYEQESTAVKAESPTEEEINEPASGE